MLYQKITKCRICGNKNLKTVVDLGHMALTGIFPKKNDDVEFGPLELVKCHGSKKDEYCGLLQLRHNYNLEKLYGDNYGYRSGLNASMVKHLQSLVEKVKELVKLKKNDLVIDIGSNDGTLLKNYSKSLHLIGIDPTIKKFSQYYPSHIKRIPDFFSAKLIQNRIKKKAKVVSSIAMFYDLEKPIDFMQEIYNVLDEDGIWMLEQSYMPMMIDNVSYDTICHEHLEYYTVRQIKWMADRVGFKIIHVKINDINGASFCTILAKKDSSYKEDKRALKKILQYENDLKLNSLSTYKAFEKQVKKHQKDIKNLLIKLNKQGKKVFGYGASTKGNVILQYCNITSAHLPFIAEVNEYKFGRKTPGTNIPIISEKEAKSYHPHYLIVLPWHFKKNIIEREKEYLKAGGHLIFPLPKITII